jgi:hypothetical protein
MLALDVDGSMIRLYDEEASTTSGRRTRPPVRRVLDVSRGAADGPYTFEFIEARTALMGVCPVVRFRDRMLLEGEEQFGIIEPLYVDSAADRRDGVRDA